MTELLRPTKVWLHCAEGRHADKERTFEGENCLGQANALIAGWRYDSPKSGGGYDKVDFRIEFGFPELSYHGRYDMQSDVFDTLGDYVIRHFRFYSGESRPPHMTQEQYDSYIKGAGRSDTAKAWLASIDIPFLRGGL
jgi:hypothetical protein